MAGALPVNTLYEYPENYAPRQLRCPCDGPVAPGRSSPVTRRRRSIVGCCLQEPRGWSPVRYDGPPAGQGRQKQVPRRGTVCGGNHFQGCRQGFPRPDENQDVDEGRGQSAFRGYGNAVVGWQVIPRPVRPRHPHTVPLSGEPRTHAAALFEGSVYGQTPGESGRAHSPVGSAAPLRLADRDRGSVLYGLLRCTPGLGLTLYGRLRLLLRDLWGRSGLPGGRRTHTAGGG